MSGSDIDGDLLALSIIEPRSFVAARNARAKELRAAKEKDRAAVVAKLARPAWTAWALNVLAREHADAARAWLDAGDALDAALTGALSGGRDGLRDAQRGERAALAQAVDQAGEVLTGAGRKTDDQAISRLTGTLRAAVTDSEVRDRLVRGILAEDIEAPSFGFGAPNDTNVVSHAAARSGRATKRQVTASTSASASSARSRATSGRGSSGAAATTGTEHDDAADAARLEREEARAPRSSPASRVRSNGARRSSIASARPRTRPKLPHAPHARLPTSPTRPWPRPRTSHRSTLREGRRRARRSMPWRHRPVLPR